MPIPRLRPDDTLLLVVDVQERLMPTLADAEVLVANTALLLEMARALEIPAVVTEQYPRGLGPTVVDVRARIADGTPVIAKTRFSAFTPEVEEAIGETRRRAVLVCGIEAHICVLQTVLDLREAGYEVFVATDAVSAGQRDQIEPALRRMEAAGAVRTGLLSAMYELMGDKRNPAFARCLDVAKRVRSRS